MFTNSVTYSGRVVLLSLLWFAVWASIQTLLLYYYNLSLKVSIIDSVLSNVMMLLVVYISNNMFRFYQPLGRDRVQRLFWGLALAFLSVYGLRFILEQLFSDDVNYLQFLHNSLPVRYVLFLLMIACMQISRWVMKYEKDLQSKKLRESEYTGLMKEAELSKLRLQLQPHFLFNSLNSINALVGSKPEEARKMIQQLSDFLRGTIKHEDRSLIPLCDEIVYLNLYLDIEKVRFGNRLQTIIECGEECKKLNVPALLLQPVVENAIKFGLYDTIDAITISVKAICEEKQLTLIVENPFDPQTQSVNKGTGFGLTSIQRRLYLLFGRKDLLTTEKVGNIFRTTIKIPQV